MMMIVNKWKKDISYRLGWKWKGPPHTLQIVVVVGTAFIICSLILTELPRNLKKDEVLLSDPSSTTVKPVSCMQFIVSSTQSRVKPNLSRNCERGPQIAKVVRKLNCEIEPLDFGLVVPGRAWCNKHAIFPIGFRSWVRYLSVIDPTQRFHYVSEILDVEISVPLFRVTLESCPTEVFMCVSAINCWDMIHDKVTQKIVSEHRQGKLNLTPLQPRDQSMDLTCLDFQHHLLFR
ncbi:hypothetical protein EJ110_NYTH32918 [Nymphaea thermarum]|nr:hypothetical protein EJ110_NYTH32918 [Nymphaea thermarum]